jgi:hypothetical protein
MILDRFIDGFRRRFPERALEVRDSGSVVAISPGSPAIGAIEIQDDLDELTVFVGDFTHGHFGCYEKKLSLSDREERVANEVLDFLTDVFDDKIEFYRHKRGGGWRPAGTAPEESYTWNQSRDA